MNSRILKLSLGLLLTSGAAQAAGPLYTYVEGGTVQPFRWDTSKGPIPVWTDGGGAFTYDVDGVTPFITIERANEITAFGFKQWSDVPTSTFEAVVAGTIESQTGIADVTGANAAEIYEVENGYGFWVNYDTDGSILEQYFGVSRNSVLGIAFPEWADENGYITEATALLNGWYVDVKDTNGDMVAGVFTHEFGHAINLSHSQVNGHIAYYSQTFAPIYQGIQGCGLTPYYRWDSSASTPNRADPAWIETMYPFINTRTVRQGDGKNAGMEQSTVDTLDDVAAISNLYPTADYLATRGSISGVLRLKDGKTEYSGINIIARNVADPMVDAVSAMSGDQTQGKVGPDGRFTINNLTPGASYYLYMEEIRAGGFPTAPMRLVSEPEYWNAAESSDPVADQACDLTPIVADAGATKTADLYFNGYMKGVDFTPIVAAYLTDLSKDGRKSAGISGATAFIWDQNKDFLVLPPEFKGTNGSMTRNGQQMLVNFDPDGNGISEATLWSQNGVVPLGSLNGDTCGGSSSIGVASTSSWAVDDSGNTAVGIAYVDVDGNGSCQSSFKGEILPFIWTPKYGIRELDTSDRDWKKTQYVRAHAISGNGRVVLGQAGPSIPVAWVNEGPLIDLRALFGANTGTYASSYDGRRVPIQTVNGSKAGDVVLWDAMASDPTTAESIGGLRWCKDVPYLSFFGQDLCAVYGEEYIQQQVGSPPILLTDANDDASVIIGRSGSFRTGFTGALWIENVGWMTWTDFFRKQGVPEAYAVPFDNPISISASGREVVGGIAGAAFSWLANIDQVYVCEKGQSIQTGFPNGLRAKIAKGAQFGRCEHQ